MHGIFLKTKSQILVLVISLSASCLFLPCKKEIHVTSNIDDVSVRIHDLEKEKIITINANTPYKADISKYFSGSFIIIETSKTFLALQYGEYDHWFSTKHIIKIFINNNDITYTGGGLKIKTISSNRGEYQVYEKNYYTE